MSTTVAAVLLAASTGTAEERLTDTLRVVSTSINPGDTGSIFLYLANSEVLGGYTVRVAFDTALLEVIRHSPANASVPAVQLRGNFAIFGFANPEPGIVGGVTASTDLQQRLDVGSGNTVRLPFRARQGVQTGRKTQITFVDAPWDTNASNWFAAFSGLYQYRPVRVPGLICIGPCQPLTILCPPDTALYCGDTADSSVTGQATASDPGAAVSFSDDTTGGPCPEHVVISRTWVARLFEETASCIQTITLQRTLPSARLSPNRPNPFVAGAGRETIIDYFVPASGRVTISIYDVVGRCLKTLVDEVKDLGDYRVSWSGQDADGNLVPSGVYLCRFSFNDETQNVKIAVIR